MIVIVVIKPAIELVYPSLKLDYSGF